MSEVAFIHDEYDYEEALVVNDDDDEEDYVEYSKLPSHPRAKDFTVSFTDINKKATDITIGEKLYYDEMCSDIKFTAFFKCEPTNNQHWYRPLMHNIRVYALHMLRSQNKIQLHGFDGTSAMCQLKVGVKREVLVPAAGAFIVTLVNNVEIVIRLIRGSSSVEWSVYSKDSIEYSQWDRLIRAAIKKYNPYINQVFDQDGKFLELPNVTFDDIFLADSVRKAVQTNIIDYIDPRLTRLKILNNLPSRRGVIFAGVPVPGKTFLSRVLANTLRTSFMVVTSLTCLSELRRIFQFASTFDRIILLFEDIDIYIKHRDFGSDFLSTMLNSLDGLETITNHMVILCTTNNVDVFDDALKNRPGRFDITVKFDIPDKSMQSTMLCGFCKDKDITDVDFDQIVLKLPLKYTGAQLKELYISTCVLALEENSVNPQDIIILTTDLFVRALDRMKNADGQVIGFNVMR